MKNRYVEIGVRNGCHIVRVDEKNPDIFSWEDGTKGRLSFYTPKELGYFDEVKDKDKIENLYLECYRNKEITSGIKQSAGWLSPGGKFYDCKYGQHDETAKVITSRLHGIWRDAVYELESLGWLRIESNGEVYKLDNKKETQAQVNAIQDILSSKQNDSFVDLEFCYRNNLRKELKLMLNRLEIAP